MRSRQRAGAKLREARRAKLRSVPAAVWVIGLGTAIAALARILLAELTSVDDLVLRIVVVTASVLAGTPIIFLLVTMSAMCVHVQIQLVRQLAADHRATARRALVRLGLFLVVLALFVVAALVWRGHPLGAVAFVVVRLLLAVALGGGTVLLALWPYFAGADTNARRPWLLAVGSAVWLVAGVFLLAINESDVGIGLVFVFMILLYGFLKDASKRLRAGQPGFYGAYVAAAYLIIGGMLWASLAHQSLTPGTVARWAGETALVAAVGIATGLTIWRGSRGARPILRRIGTGATVLFSAYLLFLLFDDQVFGGALEAPVFPLLGWLGFRLWRWMGAHRRIAVKAAADVVFALVLGATLVLLLIWLANLLSLPAAEVEVLKKTASTIGGAVELSPWIWAGVYVALLAVYLLAALGPRRFQTGPRRLASMHVVPAIKVVRRTLTMTGIGLMVLALLGVAVPATTGPIIARQIRDTYTVAAQEELEAEQEVAVYQAITSQFTASPARLTVLTSLLVDVHKTDPPDRHDAAATPAELDLALRLGKLQAQVIGGPPLPPETTSTPADLDEPMRSAEDLQSRLAEEQHEETVTKARQKQAEIASEVAASTVTSLLDLISLGHAEALGIVHEYIDGLAESPLGEIFLSWTKRAVAKVAAEKPPPTEAVLEPDPAAMRIAAEEQLFEEEAAQGGIPPVPDLGPSTGDEAAIAAIVTAEQQTVQVQEQHTSCPGCSAPDDGPDEHVPEEEHGFGE